MPGEDRRRQLNDNRRQLFAASGAIAFVCECANRDCYTTVALSADEFDLARRMPPHLLLAAGHPAEATPPATIEAIDPSYEPGSAPPELPA